jgi:membrane protease YdiL (CAAX protease family)
MDEIPEPHEPVVETVMEPAPAVAVAPPPPLPPLGAKRGFFIFAMFFLAQIAVGMVAGVVAVLYFAVTRGAMGSTVAAQIQRTVILPTSVVALALSGAVAYWLTARSASADPDASALADVGVKAARLRDALAAAAIGLCISSVIAGAVALIFPPSAKAAMGPLSAALQHSTGWGRLLFVVLALLLAPPVEEFVFRGVLLTGLARAWGVVPAALFVTLLFGSVHLMEVRHYWPALGLILAMASCAAFVRLKTGSLVPAICLHLAYNLSPVLGVYLRRH